MDLGFERFIAWRYLSGAEGRAEGQGFLRFVTYVAIGGVAVGVAALLLSLSIVRGFSHEIESKIIGFGSHIQVQSYMEDDLIESASIKRERLLENEQVTRAVPIVEIGRAHV